MFHLINRERRLLCLQALTYIYEVFLDAFQAVSEQFCNTLLALVSFCTNIFGIALNRVFACGPC